MPGLLWLWLAARIERGTQPTGPANLPGGSPSCEVTVAYGSKCQSATCRCMVPPAMPGLNVFGSALRGVTPSEAGGHARGGARGCAWCSVHDRYVNHSERAPSVKDATPTSSASIRSALVFRSLDKGSMLATSGRVTRSGWMLSDAGRELCGPGSFFNHVAAPRVSSVLAARDAP